MDRHPARSHAPRRASPDAADAASRQVRGPGKDAVHKPGTPPSGPWVYRKMLGMPEISVPNGSFVGLRNRQGRLLGRGILNRRSTIGFRIIAGPEEPASFSALLRRRFAEALAIRTDVLGLPRRTDAWRLVHGEGDGLSGLVVDRFGPVAVAGIHSVGYVTQAEDVEQALLALPDIERVVFTADERTQRLEGFRLPPTDHGAPVTITEDRVKYRVHPGGRHKTGFFLDQRDNRRLVGSLAADRNVLDLCCHAGGFAIHASGPKRARSVTALDLDEEALSEARENARLNKVRIGFVHADLYPWLREQIAGDRRWDLVVLDPPKVVKSREELSKGLRAYEDMNALALAATSPGGLLLTCSCSGQVSEAVFLEVLARAARTAGRRVRVLEVRGAAPDHPFTLDFPEGRYLKAVLLHVA